MKRWLAHNISHLRFVFSLGSKCFICQAKEAEHVVLVVNSYSSLLWYRAICRQMIEGALSSRMPIVLTIGHIVTAEKLLRIFKPFDSLVAIFKGVPVVFSLRISLSMSINDRVADDVRLECFSNTVKGKEKRLTWLQSLNLNPDERPSMVTYQLYIINFIIISF